MSITVTEKFGSRETDFAMSGEASNGATRVYIAVGSDDVNDIGTEVSTYAPTTSSSFPRSGIHVGPQLTNLVWEVTVSYGDPDRKSGMGAGEQVFNFEVASENMHIDTALADAPVSKIPEEADVFGGTIGYDGENVQGCDILVPRFSYSRTKILASATVTNAYILQLSRLVGKINDAPYPGRPS